MNWFFGSTRLLFVALLTLTLLSSCSSCGKNKNNALGDMGGVNSDTGDSDMGNGGDMSGDPDMEMPTTDEVVVTCDQNSWTPPADGLCEATPGTNDSVLFRVGSVLTPSAVYESGTVLINGTDGDGRITCVGCDCEAQSQGATVITCAEGALSAALINPHDHLTFSLSWPQEHDEERFDHRHDWRRGLRGHTNIRNNPRGDESHAAVLYGEARHLFGGAASIIGATGNADSVSGLLRNLGDDSGVEGLSSPTVDDETFPLGDFDGTLSDSGCSAYRGLPSETSVGGPGVYMPHISEGIDAESRNEFLCMSDAATGVDIVASNTSIVHGIGLRAEDIGSMAADQAKLVWTARSNIDLYGNTARVAMMHRLGIVIALGTDWSASGSINMLRELKCADYLNQNHYDEVFTDRELYLMATHNAAVVSGMDSEIGSIREGLFADLTLFDGSVGENYRAVIDAETEDVHLVLRGGTPLLGDAALVEALVPAAEIGGCEELEVCGVQRRLCIERDAGMTLETMRAVVDQNAYPIYFCGEPDREPTCIPSRPDEYDGTTDTDDDGDGLDDAGDLCPATFTPIRPVDDDQQPDFDADGTGDDCDECPLTEEMTCSGVDPDDRDADGVPNLMDNCPAVPNEDQANEDGDPYGDACDPCLGVDNTDSLACPATIYEIRAGMFDTGDAVSLDEVIVTAAGERSFFIQVAPDASYFSGVAMSGLYVFGSEPTPTVGDVISIDGRLDVFGDRLQLTNVTSLTTTASDQPLPDHTEVNVTEVATGGARAAELEGTLVRVRDVTVTDPNPDAPDDFDEFEVDNTLRVSGDLYLIEPRPAENDEFAILQGPLTFSFGNSKLVLGGPGDVVTGPPSLTELRPNPVYIRENTTGSTVPPLRIILSGPSLGNTAVDMSYSGNVSGPATVTIPDGQSEGEVTLTGTGVGVGTVEASLDGDTSLVDVSIYNNTSPRSPVALEPASSTLTVNGTATMTVTLNLPAPTGGQTVNLSYSGPVSGPATVNLPADALTATFDVTGGATAGTATVTASINATMQTADVSVVAGTPNCLIISEMIEGSGSNNKAFELYNCAGTPLQLSEFGVCLISNANSTCTATAALPAQSLPIGEVFTVCRNTSGAPGDPVDGIANNCDFQSGGVANFNGNDRVLVFLDVDGDDQFGAADEIIDSFGEPAVDPGSVWSNTTYRRCDFARYDGTGAFDVDTLYTSHPEDDATDFGTAPVEGCP